MDCEFIKGYLDLEHIECCGVCHDWELAYLEDGGYYHITLEGIRYSVCCEVADELDRLGFIIE